MLPAGFSYEGSDLSEAAVAVEGQIIAFTLLGDERFTYTVSAPSAVGIYSFSGILRDVNKAEEAVEGDSSIRVGPPPTPTPTPTPEPPTATPTATAAPEPEEGPPLGLIALIGAGAVSAGVAVTAYVRRRRR